APRPRGASPARRDGDAPGTRLRATRMRALRRGGGVRLRERRGRAGAARSARGGPRARAVHLGRRSEARQLRPLPPRLAHEAESRRGGGGRGPRHPRPRLALGRRQAAPRALGGRGRPHLVRRGGHGPLQAGRRGAGVPHRGARGVRRDRRRRHRARHLRARARRRRHAGGGDRAREPRRGRGGRQDRDRHAPRRRASCHPPGAEADRESGRAARGGCRAGVEAGRAAEAARAFERSARGARAADGPPDELDGVRSMTGYGAGRAVAQRGRVEVTVARAALAARRRYAVAVRAELADAYVAAARQLGRRLGLGGDVTLTDVLRLPDVLEVSEQPPELRGELPALRRALARALRAFERERRREGAHLRRDMLARVASLKRATAAIRRQLPRALAALRSQVEERLVRLVGGAELDRGRVAQEVAVLAERSDVTEELVRLEAHLGALATTLGERGPVGKRIEFLLQELQRELNTTGAKAGDREITDLVLGEKAEVEKLREQVQNVE